MSLRALSVESSNEFKEKWQKENIQTPSLKISIQSSQTALYCSSFPLRATCNDAIIMIFIKYM